MHVTISQSNLRHRFRKIYGFWNKFKIYDDNITGTCAVRSNCWNDVTWPTPIFIDTRHFCVITFSRNVIKCPGVMYLLHWYRSYFCEGVTVLNLNHLTPAKITSKFAERAIPLFLSYFSVIVSIRRKYGNNWFTLLILVKKVNLELSIVTSLLVVRSFISNIRTSS